MGKPLHVSKPKTPQIVHWCNFVLQLNYNPNDVIKENIKKLQARYPDKKFDVEKSENRQEGDL